jgi:hypothetical protein
MYKKDELRAYKTQFWTDFKSYMSRTRSAAGRNNSWLNYPSEVKSVFIRVDADAKGARFTLDVQGKDDGVRAIIWEQLQELRAVMEAEMGNSGRWLENLHSEAVPNFNRILWERSDLSLMNPEDKDEIFAFLKDRLVSFDRFYDNFKDILINLAS